MKFCVDCKHFFLAEDHYELTNVGYEDQIKLCKCPKLGMNLVSGEVNGVSAKKCRDSESYCGKDAVWFEEIPTPEKSKWGWPYLLLGAVIVCFFLWNVARFLMKL